MPPIDEFAGHQRAFVKVQDGCDAFCTYCIVPHLRRRVWWRPMADILTEVRRLVRTGHKEVVLCGIFLGAYGQPTAVRRRWTEPSALPELFARVSQVEGLWRVRLSSLAPGDLSPALLEQFRSRPNAAPHLHLPLQSGSAAILKKMNRQYGPPEYLDAVRRLREAVDEPAVTTDVLVGFPGETDREFAETLEIARQVQFAKIHIFPFSAREGTAAWKWRDQAPPAKVVKARCARLARIERESATAFRERFVGRTVEVIVEQSGAATPAGHLRGLTDRYIEVTFPTPPQSRLTGQVARIRVTATSPAGLAGVLAE